MYKPLNLFIVIILAMLAGCSSPENKAREYLQRGQNLLQAGEPVKAKLEFQNALQLDERLAPAWYGLALVAQGQARWDKAYALLGRVRNIDPGHLAAQVDQGRILLAAGELEQALEISNASYGAAPDNVAVMSLRAAVLYRLDDPAGAVELAQRALAADPGEMNALIVLATERITAGDPVQALAYLEPVIERNEGNVVLQLIKIEALSHLEQPDAAVQVYRRLIELYPDTDAFQLQLARFYVDQFRVDDAEQVFRERLQRKPGNMDALADLLRFLNRVAGPERARAELEQVIAGEPANMDYRFMLARLQKEGGNDAGAGATLEAIATSAAAPGDRYRATALLASQHWQAGDEPKAVALAEKILEEDPQHEQALILKSSWLIRERQPDEAISILRTVLRDSPESPGALLLLARAHELAGDANLADDAYFRAFRAGDEAPEIGIAYARFLVQERRLERAAAVLDQQLRRAPEHIESLVLLARIRVASGDWSGAQALADRISGLGDAQGVGSQIMGAVYAGRREHESSIAAFEQAFRGSSSGARPMILLVRSYASAGEYARAHAFLDSVLEANPKNATARLLRGQVYFAQGEYEKAAGVFEGIIAHDASVAAAYRNLATTLLRQDEPATAIAVLNAGLEAMPGEFDLRLFKAGLLEQLQEYEAAVVEYEELLAQRPGTEVVANNLASVLADHRQDDASLSRALELSRSFRHSEIPHFKDTLGWTHYRLGNAADAHALIGEAVEAMPIVPVFRYHLGMSYLALDDREAAATELAKALELAGDGAFRYRREVEEAIQSL